MSETSPAQSGQQTYQNLDPRLVQELGDEPDQQAGEAGPDGPRPEEIVVSIQHRGLVEGRLRRLGIGPRRQDSDADLGLVLLELDGEELAAAARGLRGEADRDEPALDRVMRALYEHFEAEYGNWVPTFGKNRLLDVVVSRHTIGGGDEGAPVNAAVDWPPRRNSPGAGVSVTVADTAVVPRPELVGSFLADDASLLAVNGAAYPPSEAGHATFVTGLVLREAPGATVRVVRVLEDSGTNDSWSVAKRIVRLGREGVDVLNLSLGCQTDDNRPPLLLATAIDRLDPDVLVVAAAGNHAKATAGPASMWPAALDDVLAVGATDRQGTRPDWSPDPARNPWVDVQAWGQDVESTFLAGKVVTSVDEQGRSLIAPFGGFARWSGTSFAAARVSGMIAAATRPGERSAREALAALIEKAQAFDGRPWLA